VTKNRSTRHMACYNSCPLTLWSYNSYSIEPLAIAKAALRVCAIHLFVCLLLCLLVCRQNAYTKRFSQKLSNLELNIILSIDDHSYIHRLFKELILGPPKIEDGERVPSWKSLNRHAYANKKKQLTSIYSLRFRELSCGETDTHGYHSSIPASSFAQENIAFSIFI